MGWTAASRGSLPFAVSLASHGAVALALGTVSLESNRPPKLPETLEFFEIRTPEVPRAAVTPPPDAVTPRNPRTSVPPTPRGSAARPRTDRPETREVTEPSYEESASLSDVLLTANGPSGASFSLTVPSGTAEAATAVAGEGVSGTADSQSGSLEAREGAIEAELAARLGREANARDYLSQRPPPELQQRADGSYAFQGPRFSAVIEADGTVRFDDNSNVDVGSAGTDFGPGLSGSFDLMDAMQGANGQDAMRAERRWFYRETKQLRDRLETEARKKEAGEGLARLERALRSLWAEGKPPADKRRLIFMMWRDTSSDEVGTRARGIIEGFVRRRLSAGSESAFTEAELSRFNASLGSGNRFDPYR